MFLSWYMRGGDITIFVGLSLIVAIFTGQEKIISRGEPLYLIIVLPALILPFLRLKQTLKSLVFGAAKPFLIFGAVSASWFVFRGDLKTIPALLLIVWVSGWACRDEARVSLKWLFIFLLSFYALGTVRYLTQPPFEESGWLMTEWKSEPMAATSSNEDVKIELPSEYIQNVIINGWGILPGQTAPAYGPWRLSVTPNIAASGIVSIFALLIAAGHLRRSPRTISLLLISAYFTVFSFVRSALVGLVIFSTSQIILRITSDKPKYRVFISFLLMFGAVLIAAISPYALYLIQDTPIVSRLLLRGQTGLSVYDIYRQAYRPWLWSQHFNLFWHSDYLMGLGSDLAKTASENIINSGHMRSDSVSFPTRLLATYGLPAFAFIYFLVERCYTHAREDDLWAISMLSVIVWLMMTWGSIFHPTNGVFVLAILIAGKGKRGFCEDSEQTKKLSEPAMVRSASVPEEPFL